MTMLPTYQQYLLNESQKSFVEFMSIDAKKVLFESLAKSPFLLDEERILAEAIVETDQWNCIFEGAELNEESIADKIKAKAKAAMQIAKEKGKEYLSNTQETILKIGGSVSSLIQKIVGIVKAFLQKAWTYIKEQVETGYAKSKEKITEAAKAKFKGKADVAKQEVKNLSSMAKSTAKWFGSISGEIGSGLNKAASVDEAYAIMLEQALFIAAANLIEESEEFVEYLKEGDHGHEGGIKIPFLSALAHKVAEFQPFKALHNIEHVAGDAANSGLNKISDVLSKIAQAPGPFEFTVVGSIFALVTGYAIKAGAASVVKEIGASAIGAMVISALPGIGVILMCMKYTAKAIWVVGICETALGVIKGGESHDKEEDSDESDKDKTKTKETEEE